MLEAATGLTPERDLFVAFSPERLYSGAVFRNLATYPKLVGGIGPASTDLASRFYASVLDAEVVAMSSAEAAELSKLAETTYRDVNIAFANELAAYASRVGVDVLEAIRAANSQPYSHIHQPGLGVGGHCIPVYPHFLLSRAPEMELVGLSRRVNDGQVDAAVERLRDALGSLRDLPVLVLGLTYREGVKELAYSRAIPLLERLAAEGARVEAWDPLLSAAEIEALGASAWTWGSPSEARAIVTQTADRAFGRLDFGVVPGLGDHPRRPEQPARPRRPAGRPRARRWRPAPCRGAARSRVARMTRHRCPQDHVMERPGAAHGARAPGWRGDLPPARRYGCGRARFGPVRRDRVIMRS